MRTVHKFELEIGANILEIPLGFEVLTVDEQHGKICLWAEVETKNEKHTESFTVFGTGHEIESNSGIGHSYLGTVRFKHMNLVWHVYKSWKY